MNKKERWISSGDGGLFFWIIGKENFLWTKSEQKIRHVYSAKDKFYWASPFPAFCSYDLSISNWNVLKETRQERKWSFRRIGSIIWMNFLQIFFQNLLNISKFHNETPAKTLSHRYSNWQRIIKTYSSIATDDINNSKHMFWHKLYMFFMKKKLCKKAPTQKRYKTIILNSPF